MYHGGMSSAEKNGVLLINLGTPTAPEPGPVGRYLREFLMDPDVIRIPAVLRWLLVNVAIVPKRRYASAALYKRIWTSEGSPLMVYSLALAKKVAFALPDAAVALAMRYGQPSIERELRDLIAKGVTRIRIVPLYPHYALSSVATCVKACQRAVRKIGCNVPIDVVAAFFGDDGYIAAETAAVRRAQAGFTADHILFSFHGIPESHVTATDPTGSHCLKHADCCTSFTTKAPLCYRAQCYHTAHKVSQQLGLEKSAYSVAFQSRLGREPWLTPFTDMVINEMPARGIKRLLVAVPSFTADCLETLEEIAMRAAEEFRAHGGEALKLVPSLNDQDDWVGALTRLVVAGPSAPLSEERP